MMYKAITSFSSNKRYAIFKYNSNRKYLTKDIKTGYNSNSFSELYVYLNVKRSFIKIQLLNILENHQIVAN